MSDCLFFAQGNNYVSGNIVNLPVGNTEVAAKMFQEQTGSELFHIATTAAYPKDYHETTNVAKKELNENARPALSGQVADMDAYDIMILGYPNWWGTIQCGKCEKSCPQHLPVSDLLKDVASVFEKR